MSYASAPAFVPSSGLGGVRALAGLGCGCEKSSSSGVGSLLEFATERPLLAGLLLTVLVGGVIVVVEAVR